MLFFCLFTYWKKSPWIKTCNQLLSCLTKTQIKRHEDDNRVCEVTCFRGIISEAFHFFLWVSGDWKEAVIWQESTQWNKDFHSNILVLWKLTVCQSEHKSSAANLLNEENGLLCLQRNPETEKLWVKPPHKLENTNRWANRIMSSADAVWLWSNLIASIIAGTTENLTLHVSWVTSQ